MLGELCAVLGGLCLVVTVVAVVGHGLWLFAAAIFRAFSGQEPPSPVAPPQRRKWQLPPPKAHAILDCLRCGEKLPADVTDCPRCGLDLEGVVSGELADLEAVARQLERFRRNSLVPDPVLDEVWKVVQVRHNRLIGAPEKEPATPLAPLPARPLQPAPAQPPAAATVLPLKLKRPTDWVETSAVEPVRNGLEMETTSEDLPSVLPFPTSAEETREAGPPPPWRRLQLLLDNRDEGSLSSSERVRLLMWYRQSPGERLEALPAATQLKLARLLREARLDEEALRTYERCLSRHPQHPEFVEMVLAAAQLAVQFDLARSNLLLRELGGRPLSPQQEAEFRRLTETVREEEGIKARSASEGIELPVGITSDGVNLIPTVDEEVPAFTHASGSVPTPPQVVPPRQKRGWNELLGAFMEEKNILWGELVGGLLIVGGSIALVVSLWNQLKENPYFPFGIFAGVTLALFGAALYTWNHWKLQTTSRGLLTIATLLVPLNFLVMPSMLGEPANHEIELAAGVVALAVFSWCLFRAGGILVPQGPWLLPVAVLGSCAGQLVAVRYPDVEQTGMAILLLGLIPLIGYFAGNCGLVFRLRRGPGLEPAAAFALLGLLGLSVFAVAVGLGFLVALAEEPLLTLKLITPLVALAGIPVLFGGLLLHERLSGDREQAGLRTGGTAILLTGMVIMLAALGLAWPWPSAMMQVCVIGLCVFLWTAFRHDLPLAHVPAIVCLAVGYLLYYHLDKNLSPELADELLQHFGSMTTALRLVFLGLGLACVSEALARWKRTVPDVGQTFLSAGKPGKLESLPHALPYIGSAGVLALLAVLLAGWHGLALPQDAMIVYGLCAGGCFAVNVRWARPWLSYVGLVLVTGATLWGLRAGKPGEIPLWSAILAGEALLRAVVGAFVKIREQTFRAGSVSDGSDSIAHASGSDKHWMKIFGKPFLAGAEWTAGLAILFSLWARLQDSWQAEQIVAGGLLLAVYLLLTIVQHRRFTAAIAGLVLVGTAAATTEFVARIQELTESNGLIACVVAGTACLMALFSLVISLRPRGNVPWYALLPRAWREVILTAGLLALWISVSDVNAFLGDRLQTLTLAAVALTSWLMVWPHRAAALSWIGSFLFLICLLHGLNWMADMLPARLAMSALLLHATVHLGVVLAACGFALGSAKPQAAIDQSDLLRRLFLRPLLLAGMIASFLAIPPLLLDQGTMVPRCWYACWLAALWLAVAWTYRQRWLLAGFQIVCMAAVIFGMTAWLEGQSWVVDNVAAGLWDPRSLQAYGVGLAVLCGLWVLARIGLQKNQIGRELLLPDWPGVDHLLLGFVVLAQLGLADWAVLRDVVMELTPRQFAPPLEWWPEVTIHVFGGGAWVLLGVLALVLILSLWQPAPGLRQTLAILGFPTLALTIPPLLAGNFAADTAVSAALRWSLAGVFLAASIPVWLRGQLSAAAARLRVPRNGIDHSRQVRGILLDGLVMPALILTVAAAGLLFSGFALAVPGADSIFAKMGPMLSLGLPLVLVSAALVGHALRENSPGYAFSAGQFFTLAITGGFALYLLPAHPFFGESEWVQILQVGALCLAGWAILWLAARPGVVGWHGGIRSRLAAPLMEIQVAVPAALSVCLLLIGVSLLITIPDAALLVPDEIWYPPPVNWTLAAGAPLGWVSLAATGMALYFWSARKVSPLGVGSLLLCLIALAGCAVAGLAADWGFRTVLLGLAGFVLGWAVFPSAIRDRSVSEGSDGYVQAAAKWVTLSSIVLLILSLEAALVHQDRLFAAGILALNGVGIAVAGLTRRSERGLFAGGLVLSLATTLAVWHFNRTDPFDNWWILLLQLNGITLALVILGWLWLDPLPSQSLDARDQLKNWLSWLVFLCYLTLAVPLTLILVLVCFDPADLPRNFMVPAAMWTGWLQTVVVLPALLSFAARFRRRHAVHFLGGAGILFIVQVMAFVGWWDAGNWLAYHALLAGLSLLGLGMGVGGWIGTSLGELGPRAWSAAQRERFARRLLDWFPALHTQRWVESLGMVLVGLALRAAQDDPARPWAPGLAVLWSGLLATGLLLWTKRLSYLHIAGGLVSLIGLMFWLAWGKGLLDRLLLFSVLALAVASLLTEFLERRFLKPDRTGISSKRLTLADRCAGWSLLLFLGFLLALMLMASSGLWSQNAEASAEALARLSGFVLPLSLLAVVVFLVLSDLKPENPKEELESAAPISFSEQSCFLGLNLLGILTLIGLAADLSEMGLHVAGPLAWAAWGVLAAASVVRTGTALAHGERLAGLPVYAAGLLGVLLLLHQPALDPETLCWLAAPLLGGYILLASVAVWLSRSQAPPGNGLLARLRLAASASQSLVAVHSQAPPGNEKLPAWFLVMQSVLGALVVALAFWICCTRENILERLVAPGSLLFVVTAFLLMAQSGAAIRPAAGSLRNTDQLRHATLILGSLLGLVLAWAVLDPAAADIGLLRHALFLVALGCTSVVYGLGLPRLLPRSSPWSDCSKRLGRAFWLLGLAAVLSVLGHEFALYRPGVLVLLMEPLAIGLVVATMLALIVSSLWFALRPAHDPFALPESRRTLYVYAAEFLLFLLFFHLRLSAPMLYGGPLKQYAPIILMGIAFAGVGLSELFNRRNLPVLAIPLQKTGIFLPLIPLLTFWLSSGDLWQLLLGSLASSAPTPPLPSSLDFARYSLYWFLAGGVYLLAGVYRRSPVFALLAALSVNFGFWSLLFHYRDFGVGFLSHPQLWLIPLAVIVLIAEHINRPRLTPAASQALRYFGLVVIYLSSTADLFLAGLGDLPMSLVLLVLSVLGILAGIQFRIRAFLFTGLIFLVLVIFARIWHAAVDLRQTWVWWASLIVLGAAILTLFAVFEKRRADLLRMLEEFKNWK